MIRFFFIFVFFWMVFGFQTSVTSQDSQHWLKKVVCHVYPDQNFDEMLLEQNSRVILGSSSNDTVVKAIRFKADGRNLNQYAREFKIQRLLFQLLNASHRDRSFLERVAILEPKNYKFLDKQRVSLFLMERLYPIKKGKFKALKRLYLGCRNNNHEIVKPKTFVSLTPGNYLSYQEVEKILNSYPSVCKEKSNIDQLCFDLGALLALVHLEAKKNGGNMEVALVKKSKTSNRYKIALLDFDKLRDLDELFEKKEVDIIVSELSKRMLKEYYFPFPTTHGFRHFRAGYLTFAEELDKKERVTFYRPLAEKVIRCYLLHWARCKLVNLYRIERQPGLSTDKLIQYSKLLEKTEMIKKFFLFLKTNNFYIQEENLFQALENY